MDSQLVKLDPDELGAIAAIRDDGVLDVDTCALARRLSLVLGLVGLRVAVSNADYLQREDGAPEPDSRAVSGVWWLSQGDDTALIGAVTIDGLAMTVTTEGEGSAPIAEDAAVIEKATRAIASQYESAEVLEPSLLRVLGPAGGKLVRVVVTRDHRVRRPQDALGADDLVELEAERLGLAIVQVVGGDKALMLKHGF